MTANVKANHILCQVIMTKTLTGYDVLVYVKISNNVIFCIKNVITERMTLNDSSHKHA